MATEWPERVLTWPSQQVVSLISERTLDETHPENVYDSYWLHSVVIDLDLFIKLWNFNYCLVLQDCLTFHFLNFHQFFSNSATHKRKANCAHYNHSVTSCCFDHKMCIFNLSQKKIDVESETYFYSFWVSKHSCFSKEKLLAK